VVHAEFRDMATDTVAVEYCPDHLDNLLHPVA
jgi:hypothetical protein